MEYINQFMNKKIFNLAQKVRIIVPFTVAQMNVARGKPIRDQLDIIFGIFKGNIDLIKDAIIPIITQVKPFEKGHEDNQDLDELREQIRDTTVCWLENYVNDRKLDLNMIKQIDERMQ